jgi:hypothetical protein
LLKDVFYDVETSTKSTNPVSQAVLDWSWQMGMQAGLLALIDSVDAFGKEDFLPDLAAVTMPTLTGHGTRTREQGHPGVPEGVALRRGKHNWFLHHKLQSPRTK